jgi:hypothetical protein
MLELEAIRGARWTRSVANLRRIVHVALLTMSVADEMCFNFILVYPKTGFSCGAGNSAFPMFGN